MEVKRNKKKGKKLFRPMGEEYVVGVITIEWSRGKTAISA
jgi:hypothetical protein